MPLGFGVLMQYSIRRYWELGCSESLRPFFTWAYRRPCPVLLHWQSIIGLVSSQEFRGYQEAVRSLCDSPSGHFRAAFSKIDPGGREWFGSLIFLHHQRRPIYSESWLSGKNTLHHYHPRSLHTQALHPHNSCELSRNPQPQITLVGLRLLAQFPQSSPIRYSSDTVLYFLTMVVRHWSVPFPTEP